MVISRMVLGSKLNMDCIEKVLKPVKRIERKGLQDLLYEDEDKRVEFWNRLEEARDLYEESDSCGADSDMHKDIESRFALARLKVATSLNENGDFTNITKRFNETELGLFGIIEEFRFFDDYSVDEIKDRIARQDGKVYSMVKKYSEKMENYTDNIFENTEIKPGIARGIKVVLKDRTDKIQEGVIEYIKAYGHVQTTNEIESAIEKIIESEQERGRISTEVQARIDHLEEELEDAKDTAAKKDRLENQIVEMEKQLLQKDFESDSLKNKISLLEEEKVSITNSYGSLDSLLENRISEVEDKRKELETKELEIQELKGNLKQDMEEENNRIIQEELDKIEEMKNKLHLQASEIENEKQSLRLQKEEVDEKFNAIREAIEGSNSGNRFVPKDLAKLYEMDHIGRFDMKMHELPMNFSNPINGKKYTVKSWGEDNTKMDDKGKIYNQFKDTMSLSEIESQLPLNVRSRYTIKERRLKVFGKKEPRTIIESMVLNHWKEYVSNGFDTRPAILSELNGLLVHLINDAEKGQYFHVIAIASPTGWDERVKTYVQSEDFTKNYVSRYVSLCLVDSESGELIYNQADERIKTYIKLFEPEFDSERVVKCKEHVRKEHEYDDHVVLDDIVKETNFEASIVRKALHELESEEYGRVLYVNGVGLVLKK